MPIDYLDPSRSGDLAYQREQRTMALDRELNYDIAGYNGNAARIQARAQRYGADRGRLHSELDAAAGRHELDPWYQLNSQAAFAAREAERGRNDMLSARAEAAQYPSGLHTPSPSPNGSTAPDYLAPRQTGYAPQAPSPIYGDHSQDGQPMRRPENIGFFGATASNDPYNPGWKPVNNATASVANDRPQAFPAVSSTQAGRANYQSYLDTLDANNREFQDRMRAQRLVSARGQHETVGAGYNPHTRQPYRSYSSTPMSSGELANLNGY